MNRLLYHKIQSGQISPEYLHEYKSLLKAQNGLGNVLPIYKNRDAFFDRNEDKGFYWKGNSLIYDCKEGEQCTARANRAVNSMVPGTTYFDWSENSKRKLGADFSTTEMPTLEQVKRYPYLEGDTKFGSLDAWDIPVTAEAKDPNLVLFRAKDPGQRISFNQYMSKYASDTPIGSYLNLGARYQNNKYQGGSHTVRVVGYLENGEPLVADFGKIVPLSKAMYVKESPDAKEIAGIVKVPGKEKYSFRYFTGLKEMANTPNTEPYITDFNNLPLSSDKGKASNVKGSSEFKVFHDALVRDKNYLRAMTGLDSDIYDRYAKIALTLGGKETAYGTGSVYRHLDWLGKSQGISQLTRENVADKYKSVLSKYKKGSSSYDAAATLLYLKELDNYKEDWLKHGKKAQERPYVAQDEEVAKNIVRGWQDAKQQGYVDSSLAWTIKPDVFRADGKEIELPYKQIWQDQESYEKEVNDYLKSKGESNLRFGFNDKGERVIYKQTKGNTIPNTIEDVAFYGWQSPNTVYYGDAQGDSKYYKGNKEIYNLLFGKMKYGGPKQPPLDKPWYNRLYNFVGNDLIDKYLGVDWFPNEKEAPRVVTPKDSRADLVKQNQELNRLMKALIAYNHGPTGTVEKLNKLKAEGHDIYNSTDWVNHFPDKEARDYALYIAKKADEKFNKQFEASLAKIPYYKIYDEFDYGDNSVSPEYFKRQMFKESSGNPKAYSSGHAAGLGQQKTIGVDEYNRLFGAKYTYDDRYDPEKSAEMQIKLMNFFYNRPWAIGVNNKKREGGPINNLPKFQVEGEFDPESKMLDPVTVTGSKKEQQRLQKFYSKYPFYDNLSDEEKNLFNLSSPIGRNIRAQASRGYGINGNSTWKESAGQALAGFTLGPTAAVAQIMSVPQAYMVEGIEQLRGNPYNYNNARVDLQQLLKNPFESSQRMPSQTFMQNAPTWAQYLGDAFLDPSFAATVSRGGFKLGQGAYNLSKAALKNIPEIQRNVTKGFLANKAAIRDHLFGGRWLAYELQNTNRPFREMVPLTKVDRDYIHGIQDAALNEGDNFVKDWVYQPADADGNRIIRPEIAQKINDIESEAYFPITDWQSTNYHSSLSDLSNPFNHKPSSLVNVRRAQIQSNPNLSARDKEYFIFNRNRISGVNTSTGSYTNRNKGFYYIDPEKIKSTAAHEAGHTFQNLGNYNNWIDALNKFDPEVTPYYFPNDRNPVGKKFADAMVEPKRFDTDPYIIERRKNILKIENDINDKIDELNADNSLNTEEKTKALKEFRKSKDSEIKNLTSEVKDFMKSKQDEFYTWRASPGELHSELMSARMNLANKYIKQGYSREQALELLRNPSDEMIDEMISQEDLNRFFRNETSADTKRKLIRMLPAVGGIGAAATIPLQLNQRNRQQGYRQGGPIVDPRGQWAHPGKHTIVPTSNGRITMQGVPYPVYGQDETGYGQMMQPGGEYEFPGQMVYEIPQMKEGGIPERYKNMGFTRVGQKKQGDGKHKWKVLAKKGDQYKVVQGGWRGMQDYKQHGSEERRDRFWDRMGGRNSSKATDPFSPLYWHKRFGTWEHGGEIGHPYPLLQKGGQKDSTKSQVKSTPATFVEDPNRRYLRDWYMNRVFQFQDTQDTFNKDKEGYLKSLDNMPQYTVVDEIPQPEHIVGKGVINGRWDKNNGKLYIRGDSPDWVKLHELNHFINNNSDVSGGYMRSLHNNVIAATVKPKNQLSGDYADNYGYYTDPDEMHSRIMVLRKEAGFNPDETITTERLEKFLKTYKFDNDNINQLLDLSNDKNGLLDMLNYMASNNTYNTDYPVAQMGGYFPVMHNVFETGGQHGGLDRWFAEKWVDVKTGKPCGRQEGENRSYPACRPSRRVSSQTPKTSSEMSPAEKAKFKRVKTSSQRISYNHKRN